MSQHHSIKNIKIAFFLNLGFTIFEIIGGLYVNSIAIISDAVHDLGDSLSLGTAWYLQKKSQKKATNSFTFGYRRLSLLGALINCIVLILGSIYVIYEAIGRLIEPEHSNAEGMIIFALIGIAVNGYAAWKMSTGNSLNEKVISWHLIEDVFGWIGILIVAIVLTFKDIHYLDPLLSLAITAYILWNVIKRLIETMKVFLQVTPHNIDKNKIEQELLKIEQISSIHHTHIWSLDGEHNVFTTHIKLKEINHITTILEVKQQIKSILKVYAFEHCTIETELNNETCSIEKNN